MAEDKHVPVFFDRNKGEFAGLTPEKINALIKAYPGVNVLAELMKMSEWLLTAKGKARAGSVTFITNWLNKSKVTLTPSSDNVNVDASIKPLVSQYLLELWKDHSHILTLNQAQ